MDSAVKHWCDLNGHKIKGRSLIKFRPVPFTVPTQAVWWFFYSSMAVEYCLHYVELPKSVKLAAMGEGTAKTLKDLTGRVDFVGNGPPQLVAKDFKKVASGSHVFFPRAKRSLCTVQNILKNDVIVQDAVCYSNEPIAFNNDVDANVLIFTSPLNVLAYLQGQEIEHGTKIFAIGGKTASALYDRGYTAEFSAEPTEKGIVDILQSFTDQNKNRL